MILVVVKVEGKNGMEKKKDYTILQNRVNKYGHLKKTLNSHSYIEMPKLIAQFEMGLSTY